jgi:spore coat polysaccharide biosynthesis predicted glycosyltransferase SpsG
MSSRNAKKMTLVCPDTSLGRRKVPAAERTLPAPAKRDIWIRTSAGPSAGFGHLRRCLILSRVIAPYLTPVFLCSHEDPDTLAQCDDSVFGALPYDPVHLWHGNPHPAVLLIDTRDKKGLARLISEARSRAIPVVSIHDLGLNELVGDIYIDGSIAPRASVAAGVQTERYTGPDFMVLEPAFALLNQKAHRQPQKISRILVNLGGGSNPEAYQKVLLGLQSWNRPIEVIGMPGFTRWGQDLFQARDWSPLKFRWAGRNEPPERILPKVHLAITAGGISAYETISAGVPLMALSLDKLQCLTVAAFAEAGACIDLGLVSRLNPQKIAAALAMADLQPALRKDLALVGSSIVDGRGAERVAGIIRRAAEGFQSRIQSEEII